MLKTWTAEKDLVMLRSEGKSAGDCVACRPKLWVSSKLELFLGID